MLKEKLRRLGGIIVKNSRIAYPVVIIAAAAVTVSVGLMSNSSRAQEVQPQESEASSEAAAVSPSPEIPQDVPQVPLVKNEIPEIYTLIATYYNAYALGDVDTIRGISNYLDETEAIRIPEMSKYIKGYPLLEVYTKEGPIPDSYLAYVYFQMSFNNFEETVSGLETFYVCRDQEGNYYLNEGEVSDEELNYISAVTLQDDVVELNNRVNVECSDAFLANADLFYYVQEFTKEANKVTGDTLAAQASQESGEASEAVPVSGSAQGEGEENAPFEPTEAVALTTVNVRVSDSEQADKLGRLEQGSRILVLELKANGWSRVSFEEKEGYIKSEFLELTEKADDSQLIGTVTASTNVNVRLSPSESAERIGVLAGGETVGLLEIADGWCKINYNGQVGYVKEEYME